MYDKVEKTTKKLNKLHNDDVVDRLSSTTTVTMLMAFTFVVTAGEYFMRPIQCFIPAEMTDAMCKYIENYCFVQNTYFMPFEKTLSQIGSPLKKRTGPGIQYVSYYQWIPIILLCQAALFYAPRLFWRITSKWTGMNMNAYYAMARHSHLCCEKTETCTKALANRIRVALELHRAARRRASSFDIFSRHSAKCFIFFFFVTKALYVANAVGQLFMLDRLLETRDPWYGLNLLRNLTNGTDWQQSGFFPRSTLCDAEIRDVGQIRRYTVQCVLMFNVFNEKLFIFLWFWLMIVIVASMCSLVFWLVSTAVPGSRRRLVRHLLPELPFEKFQPLTDQVSQFVDKYLNFDGVFILRMISDRAGAVVASRVATLLWHDFLNDGSFECSGDEKNRRENEENPERRSRPHVRFRAHVAESIGSPMPNAGGDRIPSRDMYVPYRRSGIHSISPNHPGVTLRRRDTDTASSFATAGTSSLV